LTDPVAASLAIVLDALAAPAEPALRAWLGPDADDALRAALREHALDWARAAGDGAEPRQLATAAELPAAVAGHDGPVILVAPDVPALSAVHLAAVRDDLADGVLLSSAATGDGTPFLVALSHPEPELLALVGASFNDVLTTAARLGGTLGMVRAERRLSSVGDARALLADPITPPDLRALLTPPTELGSRDSNPD
jgi:2-phospho-L-lactate guanylyltransferase (CobY/MobA/RfbA family)